MTARRVLPRTTLIFALVFGLITFGVTARHSLAQRRGPNPNATQLIDNERVTVARIMATPGERQDLHVSPRDLVAIQATEGPIEITIGTETVASARGQAFFLPHTLGHAVANPGEKAVEMIVVTLK